MFSHNFLLLLLSRKRWRKMWLILQESYIIGLNPKTGEVRVVLLFDRGELRKGRRAEAGLKNIKVEFI